MQRGLVIKASSSAYTVKTERGQVFCRARGRLKLERISPVAGDFVELYIEKVGSGIISSIMPRKNSLTRPPVANIDKLIIVASAAPPVTDLHYIDSLTALCEYKNITPVVCVNKADLVNGEHIVSLYSRLGYNAFATSAKTGYGIERLKQEFSGFVCVLTGNSGVGKSSILNLIDPSFSERTGEISRIGRGRQTTRYVVFRSVGDNGYIADTPGYSAFDAILMEMTDAGRIPLCFPEFTEFIGQCRYKDCAHVRDDGCAVRAAVENGTIAFSRYESYLKLRESILNAKKVYD